jgi:RNA polymerase nonessential primary-like sigma factor
MTANLLAHDLMTAEEEKSKFEELAKATYAAKMYLCTNKKSLSTIVNYALGNYEYKNFATLPIDHLKEVQKEDNIFEKLKNLVDNWQYSTEFYDNVLETVDKLNVIPIVVFRINKIVCDEFALMLGRTDSDEICKETFGLDIKLMHYLIEQSRKEIINIKNIRDYIVRKNIRLVFRIVNNCVASQNNESPTYDKDDLYNCGVLGLLIAIDRFSLEYKNKFSTYAVFWINQQIRNYMSNNVFSVKVPADKTLQLSKFSRTIPNLQHLTNYEIVNTAKELDIDEDKLREYAVLSRMLTTTHLDSEYDEDSNSQKYLISYDDDIDEDSDTAQQVNEMMMYIDELPFVNWFLLNAYHEVLCGFGFSLDELSYITTLSRETIRNKIKDAECKLRERMVKVDEEYDNV